MQNKLDVIQLVQQLIISSSVCIYISWYVHLLSNVSSEILPNKNPKNSQSSVKVTDDNLESSAILAHCRSRYEKFVYQKSVLTVRHIRRRKFRNRRRSSTSLMVERLISLVPRSRQRKSRALKPVRALAQESGFQEIVLIHRVILI